MNAIDTDDTRYLGFVLAVVIQMPRTSAQPRLVRKALDQLTEVTAAACVRRGELAPLAACAGVDRRRWE